MMSTGKLKRRCNDKEEGLYEAKFNEELGFLMGTAMDKSPLQHTGVFSLGNDDLGYTGLPIHWINTDNARLVKQGL